MWRYVRAAAPLALVAAMIVPSTAGAGRHPNRPRLSRSVCGAATKGHATCFARVITRRSGFTVAAASPSGYGPAQFQTAYGLPSATAGTGQTIGIVDAYDDPTVEKDLGTYSTQYGLPACTTANGCFKKVNQTGGTSYPRSNGGGAPENSPAHQGGPPGCPQRKIPLRGASAD